MTTSAKIVTIALFIVVLFWFVFALLSGSEEYGGGLRGIVMNSPNAVPWLVMLGLIYITYRYCQLAGGIIILAAGLATILLFDAYEEPFVLLLVSVPLIASGAIYIASWYVKRRA